MTLATHVSEVCDYLITLIDTSRTSLGVEQVFYGDQARLPATPVVCVEPDDTARELKGMQRSTKLTFRVYILIYHSAIGSPQDNARNAVLTAEAIETLIHSKRSLDGLVIHGMVTEISMGYANRERTVVRASRMTYEALSQELLPSTG